MATMMMMMVAGVSNLHPRGHCVTERGADYPHLLDNAGHLHIFVCRINIRTRY